jgi:indole-3-glycerol phosphate synthase
MSDFLDKMAASSRERVRAAKLQIPEATLLAKALALPAAATLTLDRFDIIAELKLRSPAAGGLARSGFDQAIQLQSYAMGGAAAVSVLTEPDEFHGTLEHLSDAAELLSPAGCPVMRKDFLTEPYQLIEARAHGASGALIIIAMLDDAVLKEMIACAQELSLFLLLEAFDANDLERLVALSLMPGDVPLLAGVNCRNLRTLKVDFARFAELADALPTSMPSVAESGIATSIDVELVAELGFSAALVGSALMHTRNTEKTVANFVAAGRGA